MVTMFSVCARIVNQLTFYYGIIALKNALSVMYLLSTTLHCATGSDISVTHHMTGSGATTCK